MITALFDKNVMSGPSHDKITIRGMVLPAGAGKTPAVRRLRPELFPVVSRSGAFERSACVLVHHIVLMARALCV